MFRVKVKVYIVKGKGVCMYIGMWVVEEEVERKTERRE